MNAPVITVIIPVYNGEKFLAACLDSLIAQTFVDWEAICVNDGSKDKSLAVLQEYVEREPRIHIIDKPNEGVSVARNAGLSAAKGRYITMMDCDDTMLPHALQTLLSPMEEDENVDLVVAGAQHVMLKSGQVTYKGALFDGNERSGFFAPMHIMRSVTGMAVTKLFRKDILNLHGIRYRADMRAGEDHEFALHYMLFCRGVFVVQKPVYNYIHHGASVSDAFYVGKRPFKDYRLLAWGKLDLIRHASSLEYNHTPKGKLLTGHLAYVFFHETLRTIHYCRKRPLYTLLLVLLSVGGVLKLSRFMDWGDIRTAWRDAVHAYPYAFLSYIRFFSLGLLGKSE